MLLWSVREMGHEHEDYCCLGFRSRFGFSTISCGCSSFRFSSTSLRTGALVAFFIVLIFSFKIFFSLAVVGISFDLFSFPKKGKEMQLKFFSSQIKTFYFKFLCVIFLNFRAVRRYVDENKVIQFKRFPLHLYSFDLNLNNLNDKKLCLIPFLV